MSFLLCHQISVRDSNGSREFRLLRDSRPFFAASRAVFLRSTLRRVRRTGNYK